MTILSVKVFDNNDSELCSTISVSYDQKIFSLIPFLRTLSAKSSQEQFPDQVQAYIQGEYIVAFLTTHHNWLLVAIATISTSYLKIQRFLELLYDFIPNDYSPFDSEKFQSLCDLIISSVDARPLINIALLGLDKSGKTTFIRYFEENQPLGFEPYQPTKLLNIAKIHQIGTFPYSFRFIDLGYSFRQNWYKFSKEADAYIFFVDSSDANRMNQSRDLLQEIRNFWDKPYVVCANKFDSSKVLNIKKYIARKFRVPIRQIYETETSTGNGLLPLLNGLINQEFITNKVPISLFQNRKKKKISLKR
jgi:signal recognition particle receptor subunit beta